jgi:hypothetical protein
MKGENRYRTMVTTLILGAMMCGVALKVSNPDVVLWTVLGLSFLAIPPAMRHAVADLARGTGTGGAWRALTTSAKPGDQETKP